jgi:hypothetical protein
MSSFRIFKLASSDCVILFICTFGPGIWYSRNVIDMDWGLVVKLALPAKVTRRANKVTGIYDRSH